MNWLIDMLRYVFHKSAMQLVQEQSERVYIWFHVQYAPVDEERVKGEKISFVAILGGE